MTTNNIQLYKLGTRYRKSWHYAKSFNDHFVMRDWLEHVKKPNFDLFGFYKANYNCDTEYEFTTFYFVMYLKPKNIVIETFLNNVMLYYPFVKEWIYND